MNSFAHLSTLWHFGYLPVSLKLKNWAFIVAYLVLLPLFGHAQFLRTSGKDIVDDKGKAILLRGMGLGGWMLQEGYMLETSGFANAQHQIRNRIEAAIGVEDTQKFYDLWLANHCTRRDIDSLKAWGFNSVRLPMHYNLFTLPIEQEPIPGKQTWIDSGFILTDSVIRWCTANKMYVILDLHAAPGGQGNDIAISDNDTTKASLWESKENQLKTVALWKKLAERYSGNPWVAGYDLINETNWNFTPGKHKNGCDEKENAELRDLFIKITDAIRSVDKKHIIFIEGNCWSNNHNGLFPLWDDNIVLSFHKYWNFNDQESLRGFLELRDKHNVPLWMGEGGENSNTWFRNAIAVLERNNIGWAWWPLKKIGSVVNPVTVRKNERYDSLLRYWKNGGPKPDTAFAKHALFQLVEDLKIENTTYHHDVVDAMFRQVSSSATVSMKKHRLPGFIHCVNYDLGRQNFAYFDKDTATHHVSTGKYTAWNQGWVYRNDGVDIERSTDSDPNGEGFHVGWTEDGEWLQYSAVVDISGRYRVSLRYAALNAGSIVQLQVDGTVVASKELPSTGGYQSWQTLVLGFSSLKKGARVIRLRFLKGGANAAWLNFEKK